MIPKELCDKYHIEELADDAGNEDKKAFYETFLIQTDHIPNKIVEAQVLGETLEDYTEILNYRQFARDEINRLSNVL